MKTKHFFSSAALVALSFFAVSCANEDTTTSSTSEPNNSELTDFVGTMEDEEPVTRVQINNLFDTPVNTLKGLDVTRASMARTNTNAAGVFSWESGDYVYVKDDQNKWYKSSNTVTTAGTSFKFKVDGTFSGNGSYTVLYKGNNANADDKVTIEANQTQSEFNNTDHFKTSGDCAVGTAQKQTNGYSFSLQHKASYLCFLPYSTDDEILNTYNKIKKVAVVASQALAGTYTLSNSGLTDPTNIATTVTLNAGSNGGFDLTNCTAANIEKSLYMVVAPSTGNFRVEITLSNGTEDKLISKTFSSVELKPNTVSNIPLNLSFKTSTTKIFDYTNEKFYAIASWVYQGILEADAAKLAEMPNANVMAWYISKGDAMWDDNTLWTHPDGKTYTGGIWIKRLAVIAAENQTNKEAMEKAGPDGKDYIEDIKNVENYGGGQITKPLQTAVPTADKIKDYFFIPAVGIYPDDPTIYKVGELGIFYSNTKSIHDTYAAFEMDRNAVSLVYDFKYYGSFFNKNIFK